MIATFIAFGVVLAICGVGFAVAWVATGPNKPPANPHQLDLLDTSDQITEAVKPSAR